MAILVGLYALLDSDGKGQVLIAAAQAVAAQRVRGQHAADGKPLEPTEWLDALAEDAYPQHDEAARLVDFAAGVEPDARELMFQEGQLGTVLCTSEDEELLGENAYRTYMSIRATTDAMLDPPDPAGVLRIHVAKDDFEEWQDNERVLNEGAWQAEVERRCILNFASMIAWWRSNFFEALLSRRNPTPHSLPV